MEMEMEMYETCTLHKLTHYRDDLIVTCDMKLRDPPYGT